MCRWRCCSGWVVICAHRSKDITPPPRQVFLHRCFPFKFESHIHNHSSNETKASTLTSS